MRHHLFYVKFYPIYTIQLLAPFLIAGINLPTWHPPSLWNILNYPFLPKQVAPLLEKKILLTRWTRNVTFSYLHARVQDTLVMLTNTYPLCPTLQVSLRTDNVYHNAMPKKSIPFGPDNYRLFKHAPFFLESWSTWPNASDAISCRPQTNHPWAAQFSLKKSSITCDWLPRYGHNGCQRSKVPDSIPLWFGKRLWWSTPLKTHKQIIILWDQSSGVLMVHIISFTQKSNDASKGLHPPKQVSNQAPCCFFCMQMISSTCSLLIRRWHHSARGSRSYHRWNNGELNFCQQLNN